MSPQFKMASVRTVRIEINLLYGELPMARVALTTNKFLAKYGHTSAAIHLSHASEGVETIQGSCEHPGENCNILHPQNDADTIHDKDQLCGFQRK